MSARTADEYRRGIEKVILPRWGGRLLTSITRRDVIELLDSTGDERGPAAAVHLFALLRKLGNWCVERDILVASPIAGMKPPAKLQSRKRVLTRSEEHTSELQSLMRISYAVFCLKKKKKS